MLTLHGRPIRRLQGIWDDHGEAVYLVELNNGQTQCARFSSIEADGGQEEILLTARFKGGQVLEENHATHAQGKI